ncbi:MAG: HNH endonuclease [Caldilineaceae bacterium]
MSNRRISPALRDRIQAWTQNRCSYCLAHQQYVLGPLEIDHIIPQALGGTNEEGNLCLACRLCNSYKATQIDGLDIVSGRRFPLYHPRKQRWAEHFRWTEAGDIIVGVTPYGRVTVEALQLNNVLAVTVRRAWISAGWHPPT